jgi:hypothetical protein
MPTTDTLFLVRYDLLLIVFFFIKALGINLHSVHIPSFLYLIRPALQLTLLSEWLYPYIIQIRFYTYSLTYPFDTYV